MLSIRHPARVTLHDCRCVITCAFCAACEDSNELKNPGYVYLFRATQWIVLVEYLFEIKV